MTLETWYPSHLSRQPRRANWQSAKAGNLPESGGAWLVLLVVGTAPRSSAVATLAQHRRRFALRNRRLIHPKSPGRRAMGPAMEHCAVVPRISPPGDSIGQMPERYRTFNEGTGVPAPASRLHAPPPQKMVDVGCRSGHDAMSLRHRDSTRTPRHRAVQPRKKSVWSSVRQARCPAQTLSHGVGG